MSLLDVWMIFYGSIAELAGHADVDLTDWQKDMKNVTIQKLSDLVEHCCKMKSKKSSTRGSDRASSSSKGSGSPLSYFGQSVRQ